MVVAEWFSLEGLRSVEPRREASAPVDRRLTFERLTQDRLDRAYRLAAAILRDPGEAEDAVQDAAEQAWDGWDRLRDVSRFDAWFDRILVNRCRDRLRKRVRATVLEDSLGFPVLESGMESAERVAIGEAVSTLGPDHRIVVILRFAEDLSIGEIAARTGQREGTVKSRLHYALRQLRAAYDAAGRPAGGSR
jgi:RNA polymerase sigma-70 factor (ECF subfamily)